MKKIKLYPQTAEFLESLAVEELEEMINKGGCGRLIIEDGHITGYEKREP